MSKDKCEYVGMSDLRIMAPDLLLKFCSEGFEFKTFSECKIFLILYLFECMQIPQHPWGGVKGQSAVISPLLPPCGSQELNSGHQA